MSESILDSWWFFFYLTTSIVTNCLKRASLHITYYYHILFDSNYIWEKTYIATDYMPVYTIVLCALCASFYQFSHYHIFFLLCELNAFVYSIFPLHTHTCSQMKPCEWWDSASISGHAIQTLYFFVRVNSFLFALFFIC